MSGVEKNSHNFIVWQSAQAYKTIWQFGKNNSYMKIVNIAYLTWLLLYYD